MNGQSFGLQPFVGSLAPSAIASSLGDVKLTGTLTRQANRLRIDYLLEAPLPALVIPPRVDSPLRRDELWQSTCFEFFLGLQSSEDYWEFNLSPAGHWNIYRFQAYRQGMQRERAIRLLPFDVQRQGNSLLLTLDLDLDPLVRPDQGLEVGISTVLQSQVGEVSYWALTHPGSVADFHRRDSFILQV
jgi:hypothetical protein